MSPTFRTLALCTSLLGAPLSLTAQQRVQIPARDKVLPDTPATVYTIGKAAGESWEELTGVRAAAFDLRDNLYVLDANNFRVLVFDATGRFLRSVGRKGEGPGEFIAPGAMVVSPDGTIVVSDLGRRAFSLFKNDGTFLRNEPFPEAQGMGMNQPTLYAHPRSGVVAQMFGLRTGGRAQPTGERLAPVAWFDFPLAATTASQKSATRTLIEFRLPSITPQVRTEGGRVTGVSTMPPNWAPPSSFGVLADGGLALVRDAAYRVEVTSPTGAVQRVIERAITPRRGTDADKERYIAVRIEELPAVLLPRDGGDASAEIDKDRLAQQVRGSTWLDPIPVLRGLVTDPGGRIWVARTPADFGKTGPVDLLRVDGSYIGTVLRLALPAAVSRSGRAAFIERDALGVEHVTVKRLPDSWR